MLSSMDDYPLHQIPDVIRHVGSSDRNFYDRYYFNLHATSGDFCLIFGLGQYPNLGVQDAFALLRRGREHRVLRASRALGDRMDTSVGPLRVEVLEGLRRVRCLAGPNEHGLELDLVFEGAIPAFEEPRQYIRRRGRVLFDTMRFAQTGRWSGWIRAAGEEIAITPDRHWGTRDRSWGIRPVGEPEPPGIRAGELPLDGMWNYAPMQFEDFSILYMCHERPSGERPLEEGVRLFADPKRDPEWLGAPEHAHVFRRGTRVIERSTLSFPAAPGGALRVEVTPLLPVFVGIGTGYGFDADWRHGAYQGPLVVQGVLLDAEKDKERLWGLCDAVARFETAGHVGFGLFEYGLFGPLPRYGFKEFLDGAP